MGHNNILIPTRYYLFHIYVCKCFLIALIVNNYNNCPSRLYTRPPYCLPVRRTTCQKHNNIISAVALCAYFLTLFRRNVKGRNVAFPICHHVPTQQKYINTRIYFTTQSVFSRFETIANGSQQ